jgi:hypothetical protein
MILEQTATTEELIAFGNCIISLLSENNFNEVDKYIIIRGLYMGLVESLKEEGIIIVEKDVKNEILSRPKGRSI